jgi:hypothetical protein
MVLKQLDIHTINQLECTPFTIYQNNSKVIINLNVIILEQIKPIEQKCKRKSCDIVLGTSLL